LVQYAAVDQPMVNIHRWHRYDGFPPVFAVPVNGDIRISYARADASSVDPRQSRVVELLQLGFFIVVAAVVITVTHSPKPWVPMQCFDLGNNQVAYGYALAEHTVLTEKTRHIEVSDNLAHRPDQTCRDPKPKTN
jgi:hypothetical protein